MSKQDEICRCGGELERVFLEGFDFSPYIKSGFGIRFEAFPVLRCQECAGETVASVDIETGLKVVAATLIESDDRLGPAAAKTIRRIAGLTQQALADRLGASRETVANWERTSSNKFISPQYDYMLRGVVATELLGSEPRSEDEVQAHQRLQKAALKSSKAAHTTEEFFAPETTQIIKLAG